MMRKTPTVWVVCWGEEMRAEVEFPNQSEHSIRLDSPAWWAWLERPTTRSFAYPIYERQVGYICGFMTVRKERRVRGSSYWSAYHRTGGRLRKLYLGRASQLTQQHLGASAERFLAMGKLAAQREIGTDGQKEVMEGQHSGASLRREVMMRRLNSSHWVAHLGRPWVVHIGRPWVARYGRRWWYIRGRLLTPRQIYARDRAPHERDSGATQDKGSKWHTPG
jgi:hypothetical protein